MKKIFQKSINFLLILSMLMTVASGLCITANAEQTKVEIVSFVGGNSDNLRSSELLEARITGYDGKISDLTFTWDNQLGTYLYIYNSSNMYNIKDTAGEIELYGESVRYEWNWSDFSYTEIREPGETITVKGYAWAAVYGADLGTNSLKGTISVTVTDQNGNVRDVEDLAPEKYAAPLRGTEYDSVEELKNEMNRWLNGAPMIPVNK